ncbi:T9SS type A sorting domain-containing protein, partial [bacterium AH-315-M05]|nr:T9SS type A sorting domain-containing protein [bacterium AH-315-M05]
PIVISIQNALGQIIIAKEVTSDNGYYYQNFNLKYFGTGMYNLQIVTERGLIHRKVVVFKRKL